MQLTNTQLDLIDRFLEQHQLDFLDFKFEVKDHLACETEQIMANENIGFEEAFVKASKNWENELELKPFHAAFTKTMFPKLVVNSIKKTLFIQDLVISILAIIVTIVAKSYLESFFTKHFVFFKYSIAVFAIIYMLLRRTILIKKLKTSFSYRFDYLFYPILICLFYLFLFNQIHIDTFRYFIVFSILIQFPFSIFYFMKHQQFIKKHFLA